MKCRSNTSSVNRNNVSVVLFIGAIIFCVENISAQIYSYTNNTGGIPASVNPNASGSNLSMVNGAGVPGSPCATGFSVINFGSAITYAPTFAAINIDITPNTGYQLNISSFSADLRRSTTGPSNVRYAYSIDGGANWIDEGADHGPNNAGCGSVINATWNVSFTSPTLVKFRIYGFNASQTVGVLQLLNVNISGTVSPCAAPLIQATDILLGAATGVTLNINWTDGDGSNRVVIMNTVNFFTNPANGTSPAANNFYSGSGEQVIYNSNGNSLMIFGLTPLTTYWFRVYEYNCWGTGTVYLTTPAIGNPASYSTSTASTSTDFFRSQVTGMWATVSTWESSPDNGITPWVTASLIPTNNAAAVTIQSGHTVTINTNATAPNLSINGTLTFDNTVRTITVSDYVTINAGGTFITQASGAATHVLTIGGDMINNGAFDMSRATTTLVCIVSFNRNFNQTVSGTGNPTRFYKLDLNMGSSNNNVLDITVSNFSATNPILSESAIDNKLHNGTLKLSVPFTGTFFTPGATYTINTNAGIWLNNSSISITGQTDTYLIDGLLRITSGTMNAGTSSGNSVHYRSNSRFIIEGGVLNIAGRLSAATAGTHSTIYTQSGGTVTVLTVGSGLAGSGGFDMSRSTSTFTMSGGTIILRRATSVAANNDYYNPATLGAVTGGTIQFGDGSSPNGAVLRINSSAPVPNLLISNATGQATKPTLQLKSTLTATGDISVMSGTTLDVSYNSGTNSFDILLAGSWIQDGTFTYRNRKVTYNGSNAQTIGGTISPVVFYDLDINKPSGDVTLNKPVTVNNSIALNSGRVFSTSTNILTLLTNATVTAVSNSSFVHGPVSKIGEGGFTFPVGKSFNYRPIDISADAPAIFWTENFNNGCTSNCNASTYVSANGAWSVASLSAEGSSANRWYVSCAENGQAVGACGAGCGSNATLHISATGGLCGGPDCGAAYNATSAVNVTDKRVESPVINCTGKSNITLSFKYIENGEGTNDNATLWYYDGSVWAQLADMTKTATGCCIFTICQGIWTNYSVALPASANNNANVKIGLRWVNDGNGVGTDPSVAIDDIVLSTPSATFTAEYFPLNPQLVYGSNLAPTLNHVSYCEYWILDRTSGTLNKNVTLSWDATSCGVTLLSDLRVARFNTTLWADEGNTATTGSTAAGTVTSGLVTSFSPFTLSSVSTANPLPIELLNFNAVYNGIDVDVIWATATEINNNYFTVLRSTDGFLFRDLEIVPGAGNSSTIKYYATKDAHPHNGISYYQLKQTDFDGTSSLSQIVPVQVNHDGITILFVNAETDENIVVGIAGNTSGKIKFEISDVTGRMVYSNIFNGHSGNLFNLPAFLSQGLYVLCVSDNNKSVTRKFVY